jgi:hypothetical protein
MAGITGIAFQADEKSCFFDCLRDDRGCAAVPGVGACLGTDGDSGHGGPGGIVLVLEAMRSKAGRKRSSRSSSLKGFTTRELLLYVATPCAALGV